MMNRRRALMAQTASPAPGDLYDIGTDVVQEYIRDSGTGFHVGYTINQTTGAYENNGGSDYASADYIPVRYGYTLTKSTARMQYCGWYDADKNFISGFREYNTTEKALDIPQNAAFMRISTNSTGAGTGTSRLKITRTA